MFCDLCRFESSLVERRVLSPGRPALRMPLSVSTGR